MSVDLNVLFSKQNPTAEERKLIVEELRRKRAAFNQAGTPAKVTAKKPATPKVSKAVADLLDDIPDVEL